MKSTPVMEIVIDSKDRLSPFNLRELWAYRELLYFMSWRQITVRYAQTALGIWWMIVQPVASLVLYSLVFGGILGVPSGDIPYPVFVFSGMLPWRYFTAALNSGTSSIISNSALISKVYFPRQIVLLSATIVPLVDFLVSFVLLLLLMAGYGYMPFQPEFLLLPALVLLAMASALAVSLWLSALNVFYRDIGPLAGFLTQAWMYITPVIYPAFEVPAKYQTLYRMNPMVGVVEGFRWVLLGSDNPDFQAIGISVVVVLITLTGGLYFFSYLERRFGDVI